MSRFTSHSGIRPLPKENKRELTEDLVWDIGCEDSPMKIVVPKGFKFDGASSPRILWSLIPPTEYDTILASTQQQSERYFFVEIGNSVLNTRFTSAGITDRDANGNRAKPCYPTSTVARWCIYRVNGLTEEQKTILGITHAQANEPSYTNNHKTTVRRPSI